MLVNPSDLSLLMMRVVSAWLSTRSRIRCSISVGLPSRPSPSHGHPRITAIPEAWSRRACPCHWVR